MPPAAPWPIVAQQALGLTLECGELATPDLITLLQRSFPGLQAADIEALVEHLVERQFLDRAEGVLRIGAQTEHDYARGHYRDLLAFFRGSPSLTGRHGTTEVGYIEPTVLTGERDERLLSAPLRSRFVTFDIALPDATAMRQIVRARHAEVCGTAPFEPLADEVVDLLVTLSPREVGQRLRAAVGRAALRAEAAGGERLRVVLADVGSRTRDRMPMGFGP